MIIKKAYAAKDLGWLKGIGRLGLEDVKDPSESVTIFTDILSGIVGIMTIAAAIWFIFNFISGAYKFISAGGDQQKIQDAQKLLQNAFIGLFLVIASIFLLGLVGTIIGVPFLDFGALFERIINQAF